MVTVRALRKAARLNRAVSAGRGRAGWRIDELERRVFLDATVVFNEIHYNPPGVGATSDNAEWIELHNTQAVDMDLSGWRLDNGIDFKFPNGTILKGGKQLVIAAVSPAQF